MANPLDGYSGDIDPHSGRIFNMVLNRKFVICPPGGKNFVDVRDAATVLCWPVTIIT
jgi:hypothetical protein